MNTVLIAAAGVSEPVRPELMTSKLTALIVEVEAELQAGRVSQKFDRVSEFLADLKR